MDDFETEADSRSFDASDGQVNVHDGRGSDGDGDVGGGDVVADADVEEDERIAAAKARRYELVRRVGGGNYGSVWLCKCAVTGAVYVVKKVALGHLSSEERRQSKQEVDVLRRMRHANVVRYVDSYIVSSRPSEEEADEIVRDSLVGQGEESTLHIVMEFCDRGDLSRHINATKKARKRYSEAQILEWFSQLTSSLHYIHSLNIMHRDLKTSNVFLTTARAHVRKGGEGGKGRKGGFLSWRTGGEKKKRPKTQKFTSTTT